MNGRDDRCSRAFAPAHVTGIFRPERGARDPRGRGSIGAGVVLELGVRADARFTPGGPRRLLLTSDVGLPLPISEEVARRLRPSERGTVRVHLVHELPVGQGFGTSAAGATATALAVAALSGRTRTDAVEVAHLADLFGAGGLGGVASVIGGGGVEFRVRPGLPPRGQVVHRPLAGTLWVGLVGRPLPSSRILQNDRVLDRILRASEELPDLLRRPDPTRFFELSERFTDRVRLASPGLARTLRALRRRGSWASQAMFGRSFFARPRDLRSRAATVAFLQSAGIAAIELSPARAGARALAAGDASLVS